MPFKITSRSNLLSVITFLLLDLKECQTYPYTYEETEAPTAEEIIQGPLNDVIHNGMSTISGFVWGEGTNISLIVSYPYWKKLRHLVL